MYWPCRICPTRLCHSAVTIAAQLGGKASAEGPHATFCHRHGTAAGVPINLHCHFSCVPPLPWQHSWSSHGYAALCSVMSRYRHSSSTAGSPKWSALVCPKTHHPIPPATTTTLVAQLEEGGIGPDPLLLHDTLVSRRLS